MYERDLEVEILGYLELCDRLACVVVRISELCRAA